MKQITTSKTLNIARIVMFSMPVFMLLCTFLIQYFNLTYFHQLNLPFALPLFALMALAAGATYYLPVVGIILYVLLQLPFPWSFAMNLLAEKPEEFDAMKYYQGALWMQVPPLIVGIYLVSVIVSLQKTSAARKASHSISREA